MNRAGVTPALGDHQERRVPVLAWRMHQGFEEFPYKGLPVMHLKIMNIENG